MRILVELFIKYVEADPYTISHRFKHVPLERV